MEEHAATFEVESKTDAYAIERLTNSLYDSLREESRTIREVSGDSTEMLEQFKTIRDAARDHRPGRLTVIYELLEEDFEE